MHRQVTGPVPIPHPTPTTHGLGGPLRRIGRPSSIQYVSPYLKCIGHKGPIPTSTSSPAPTIHGLCGPIRFIVGEPCLGDR